MTKTEKEILVQTLCWKAFYDAATRDGIGKLDTYKAYTLASEKYPLARQANNQVLPEITEALNVPLFETTSNDIGEVLTF